MSNRPFNDDNFQSIFKTYFGPLCNYVNSNINDWEGSREIVQGAFMKIWENRESIEVQTTVKTYLYSSVRNRMIDYIRSSKRREDLNDAVGQEDVYIEDEKELDSMMIRQEIMKSLDRLKPKMKKIFVLSKVEGLTYGEVANYLNISKRSVEDNVAKALVLLREDLKKNELIFA